MKIKDLIATIELDGWQQIRQKGSHRQYHHPIKSGTVTIAGKPSVECSARNTFKRSETSGT
jgi:predicted RNA binding protein YcfA (HicA-like mRNA interferase family)